MKRLLFVIIGLVFFASTLSANPDSAIYQGQKTYLVKLKASFKLDAQTFASQHTAKEWVRLFDNDAQAFIDQYSQRYPRSSRYLHSKHFQKKASDLLTFAMTYAKDSGQTPVCTCVL